MPTDRKPDAALVVDVIRLDEWARKQPAKRGRKIESVWLERWHVHEHDAADPDGGWLATMRTQEHAVGFARDVLKARIHEIIDGNGNAIGGDHA